MAYRDELDAARIRRDNLRRELSEIDRHLGRRAELGRALEEASRAVDRARSKVALPLLATIRIASPCSARWDDMVGDERVRHCGSCDKKVYDLSAMRAEEAEALLRSQGVGSQGVGSQGVGSQGTGLCTRFYRRADGTVMTSDCAVGARRVRLRNLALAGMTAVMLGTSFLSIAGGAAFLVASASEIEVIDVPPPPPMGAAVFEPEREVAAMGEAMYVEPDPEVVELPYE